MSEINIGTPTGVGYEALLCERTCGNRVLGQEIHIVEDGTLVAQLPGADDKARVLATMIVDSLNDRRSNRVPKALRIDRGQRYQDECNRTREHMVKTFKRNMDECQSRWELLDHLVRTGMTTPGPKAADYTYQAIKHAAELYGCRQFVLGVIAGRCHSLPDKEQEDLKRQWEVQWDTAFGDLVGQVLKFQE